MFSLGIKTLCRTLTSYVRMLDFKPRLHLSAQLPASVDAGRWQLQESDPCDPRGRPGVNSWTLDSAPETALGFVNI